MLVPQGDPITVRDDARLGLRIERRPRGSVRHARGEVEETIELGIAHATTVRAARRNACRVQKNAEHVRLEELGHVQEREVEITSRKPGEERSELERYERDLEALPGEVLLQKAREHAA